MFHWTSEERFVFEISNSHKKCKIDCSKIFKSFLLNFLLGIINARVLDIIFIPFYFTHSISMNSTSQIVPSTKSPRVLVSRLESLYNVFFIFCLKIRTN